MKIEELRKKIDQTDSEILSLISRRMLLSIRAGRLKKRIRDEKREEEILNNLRARQDRLVSSSFSEELYGRIFTESKRLQGKNFKLAGFQGERGAFGESACEAFNNSYIPVPCLEFSDVFEGVSNGEFDFGIVPIENSSEGAITSVSHLVTEKDVKVVGEVVLPVHHSLLGLSNESLEGVKVVYSHPQALAQCRNYIINSKLEPRPYYDTAGAAAMIAKEKPTAAAAIAGRNCSDLYGLKVLDEDIEDSKSNFTRFLVVSKVKFSGKGDKCSITFSTKDKAGALSSVLGFFKEVGINLTMIESIPSRDSTGRAKFLIDFIGSDRNKKTIETLKRIKAQTTEFKLLGCYRSWSK